jgi:hypothetical protein
MMNTKLKKMIAILGCVVLLWAFTVAQGAKGRTYEIHPQIPESVFKSDSVKALEAYERMVDRVLAINSRQLDSMELNIKSMSTQLNRVEMKLDMLLNRTLLIENAPGISHLNAKNNCKKASAGDPNTPDKE